MNPYKQDLIQAYNNSARRREGSTMQGWKGTERAKFLALLQERGKKTLLELGAGTGRDSAFFQSQGLNVTCVDLSPKMVEFCKEKGLDAHVMDMTKLNFPAASFNAIYAMSSLLHLTKAEFPQVLESIHQLLAPGGLFYLGVYGGIQSEGVWENDQQTPKRFFSFFEDEKIKEELLKVFHIHSFELINLGKNDGLHYQAIILEKEK